MCFEFYKFNFWLLHGIFYPDYPDLPDLFHWKNIPWSSSFFVLPVRSKFQIFVC